MDAAQSEYRGGSRGARACGATASRTFPDEFHRASEAGRDSSRNGSEILHGAPIDWAIAETLAFGSLVLEGTPVRLSGQDSGRGTFSQRHLEFYDSETGERYIPLQHLAPEPGALRCLRQPAERVRRDGISSSATAWPIR